MSSPFKITSESIDVDRILSLLTEISRASTTFKTQTALGYARNLLTELPSLKSALRKFQNSVISVQEGLGTKDLTQAEARAELKSANSELEAATKKILSEISKSDAGGDSLDLSDLKDGLGKFDANMNELQTKLTRSNFVIGLTTIVPITTPFLSREALKRNGFKVESFHGYSVLSGQMVAGLHSDYIKKQVKVKADEHGPAKTANEVFDDFVGLVKLKYKSQNLMVLGGVTSWWGASWVWLIPERQFKVLRASTDRGTNSMNLRVSSWGFPFDRSK